MPFQYDPDGSLTLYFQNEDPGKEKQANWLPAAKSAFNLMMRSTRLASCRPQEG